MASNINSVSTPVVPPADPFAGMIHGKQSGMMLAMMAFMENYQAVQNYSTSLMALSETVEAAGQAQSQYMLTKIIGQSSDYNPNDPNADAQQTIMGKIEWIIEKHGDGKGADTQDALAAITPQLTVANTQYSQVNTFFSGLDNATNQNSSDTTQTLQVDLQEAQSGPLSTLQTLAQVWR